MKQNRKRILALVVLLAAAVVVMAVAPFVGLVKMPLSAAVSRSAEGSGFFIFWHMRVPRVIVAMLAGAALAASGMVFQAMFRNPLATPFTLGVASGASLGAAMYLRLGGAMSAWLAASLGLPGTPGISIAAFIGALASILLVYGLAQARRGFSGTTMLLAGVAVSFLFSSVILLMHYIGDIHSSYRLLRWIMGGLQAYGYDQVLRIAPFAIGGSAIVLCLTRELNLLTTGEDLATSRGVDVRRVKRTLFFATSLMVGGVVAVCGPIGFIGMMAPHICRLLIGADHRYLLPATMLFGAMFLTLCDLLARTLIAPAEIPVGVITALLGGPFFLWLLLRRAADIHTA